MKALIIGINGQDGSFMAELLIKKDYEVYGMIRRSSINNLERLKNIKDNKKLNLLYGDLTDSLSILNIIKNVQPDEIYNFGAQSDVKVSFDVPEYTADVDGIGVLRILEAVHILHLEKKCKIYQSSTSELYGNTTEKMQDEKTPFIPDSPYAAAKLYAYNLCEIYKKAYGMYIVNGILFNHESERRGEEFVTRKITLAATRIAKGKQEKLYLGNIYSKRDWGYAKDYVETIYKMMQKDKCDNYVIATGKQYTIKEFCTLTFKKVGIELKWNGEGIDEKGIDKNTKKIIVEIDKSLYRPIDVINLKGNPQKAVKELGFNPEKTSLEKLIDIMVENDMKS